MNALSRSPHEPAPFAMAEDGGEVQISLISEFSDANAIDQMFISS